MAVEVQVVPRESFVEVARLVGRGVHGHGAALAGVAVDPVGAPVDGALEHDGVDLAGLLDVGQGEHVRPRTLREH